MITNQWAKSSHSLPDAGNCVETRLTGDGNVQVRDTKDGGKGPILTFTPAEWTAFIGGVKDNEFNL